MSWSSDVVFADGSARVALREATQAAFPTSVGSHDVVITLRSPPPAAVRVALSIAGAVLGAAACLHLDRPDRRWR